MTNIVGGGELDTGTTREDPLSLTHAMAEDKVVSVLALAMAEEVVVAVTPVAMAEDEVVSVLALAMAEEVVVAVTPVAMAEDEVALVMAERSLLASLLALLDGSDGCQYLTVRRLLASACEGWAPLSKVHELLGILPDPTKVMRSGRHIASSVASRSNSR